MQINGHPFSYFLQKFPKKFQKSSKFPKKFLPGALWATDLLHPSRQSTVRIGSLCSGIGPEPALDKKKKTPLKKILQIYEFAYDPEVGLLNIQVRLK